MRVIGLMSGTSADGVDAVLVAFRGDPNKPIWSLINYASVQYSSAIREKIVLVGQGMKISSKEWLELSEEITEVNARAALLCDPARTAKIIGCHGQTLWHRSPIKDKRGGSLQVIQAPLLAYMLDKPVIFDFRSKDLALGGHGAPLVPLVDEALIGRVNGWRAVLNLGGISNLTLIPPKSGPDRHSSVFGWDCGPANTLMDLAVQDRTYGAMGFDIDGKIASNGEPRVEVIEQWLKEPFFQKSAPKSTGREEFGLKDLKRRMSDLGEISKEDLLSTLTAFSAAVVAQDLHFLLKFKNISPIELLVAGGGCKNSYLMNQVVANNRGMRVRKISEIGMPNQLREAIAFAMLGWWHVINKPVFAKDITGSSKSSLLGTCVNPA